MMYSSRDTWGKMFNELKKCKSIRGIYETMGLEKLEKPAYLILCLWALLPVWSIWAHIFWGLRMDFSDARTQFVWASYRDSMLLLGEVTWIFLFVYIVGLIVLKRMSWKQLLIRSPWNLCFLAMLLWAIPATLLAKDPSLAFWGSDYRYEGLFTYFMYAGIFCLAQIVKRRTYRFGYFRIFVLVACLLSVGVILQDAGVPGVSEVFYVVRATVFFQFNHMGYYLCMSTLCAMGLVVLEDSAVWRGIMAAAAFLQMYALLVNSTLGGYLGVLVGLVALMIFTCIRSRTQVDGRLRRRALWVTVAIFIVTTLMSYGGLVPTSSGENMQVNLETMFSDTADLAAGEGDMAGHGRMTLWKTGLQMIPKHPMFGFGPEHMDEELMATIWNDRIDNEFIQYAISLGIPGALFYLVGLFLLAFARAKNLKQLSPEVILSAVCVFGYLCSSCLGNSMFYTMPYFLIFLGMVGSTGDVEKIC